MERGTGWPSVRAASRQPGKRRCLDGDEGRSPSSLRAHDRLGGGPREPASLPGKEMEICSINLLLPLRFRAPLPGLPWMGEARRPGALPLGVVDPYGGEPRLPGPAGGDRTPFPVPPRRRGGSVGLEAAGDPRSGSSRNGWGGGRGARRESSSPCCRVHHGHLVRGGPRAPSRTHGGRTVEELCRALSPGGLRPLPGPFRPAPGPRGSLPGTPSLLLSLCGC